MSKELRIRLRALLTTSTMAFGAMVFCGSARADDGLRVDEWGTFTALQNENGDALPGINIDDEPLPAFCHNLHPWVIEPARSIGRTAFDMKGVPQRHPDVTLRLETPVIYFHPPAGEKLPFSIDVDVRFRGGWLTEFYPQARPDEPGLQRNAFNFGPITPDTIGALTWTNVQVGSNIAGPHASEHVWIAPRNVEAASVTVGPQTDRDRGSESERFLFYRGVANRPVPLRISHDESQGIIYIHGQCADCLAARQSMRIAGLWLVDTRRDGAVAFRPLDPITVTADAAETLATARTGFSENDYAAGDLDALREKMHSVLVGDGLMDDEATAMLETWKHAYFQSPGLRVFFLVPRAWTDAVLPLKLSRPADLHRVMMGRIELISSEQRQLLKKLSAMKVTSPQWIKQIPDSPNAKRFLQGRGTFGDLGVRIPDDYQVYLDLGRFRNSLVLAEERARPTPELKQFIDSYGLHAYEP